MIDPKDDRTAVICTHCRAIFPAVVYDKAKGICPCCGFNIAHDVATKRQAKHPPEAPA